MPRELLTIAPNRAHRSPRALPPHHRLGLHNQESATNIGASWIANRRAPGDRSHRQPPPTIPYPDSPQVDCDIAWTTLARGRRCALPYMAGLAEIDCRVGCLYKYEDASPGRLSALKEWLERIITQVGIHRQRITLPRAIWSQHASA